MLKIASAYWVFRKPTRKMKDTVCNLLRKPLASILLKQIEVTTRGLVFHRSYSSEQGSRQRAQIASASCVDSAFSTYRVQEQWTGAKNIIVLLTL